MSTDSTANTPNIFQILAAVNRGFDITLEQAQHLEQVTRHLGYRHIIDTLEQRTPRWSWLCCEGSGLYFPEYQEARTVGRLDGDAYFLPYLRANEGSGYHQARDRHGDFGYTTDDDAVWVDCDDEYITRDRYERQGYMRCDRCEEVFHEHDMYYREHRDETYCESCDPGDEEEDTPDSNTIHSYNTRVEDVLPMQLTRGVRYFGLELEQEFPNGRPEEECTWAMDEHPDLANLCIWKSDGSLSNGAELVSLPRTLKYWQAPNPVKALCGDKEWRKVARSHKTSTCGLHIHVSRNTVPEPAIAKLVVLMNDPSMTETISLIARRAPNTSYCMAAKKRWLSDQNGSWVNAKYQWENYDADKPNPVHYARPTRNICKKQSTQGSRYTPINLTEHTIEFRIFRGTLHWPTIIASIEFCDAALWYCQQFGASAMNAEAFNQWLRSSITRKTYPALRDYLELRTLLPKRKAKPEVPTADTSTQCRNVEETPAATFVMDPYDGSREEWHFSTHTSPYFVTEGAHYIAYFDNPVPVVGSMDTLIHVAPGEIWWNSTRTCSLRVEPTNVQI